VSCYTRHLSDLLPADPSPADQRALDEAIRSELFLHGAECDEVWVAVQGRRADPNFMAAIRRRMDH
jgi:hypothetical protein